MDDYDTVTPVDDGKKKFRFNIHDNNKSTIRVFRFHGENAEDTDQWIRAIAQVFKVSIRQHSINLLLDYLTFKSFIRTLFKGTKIRQQKNENC